MKILFDEINQLIKSNELVLAEKKLSELHAEEKKVFRYVKLSYKIFMQKKEYVKAEKLLLNKTFETFRYYHLLCDYYSTVDNIENTKKYINIFITKNPPENLKLQWLEKLSILESNFLDAADCLLKLIKTSERSTPYTYNKLLEYLHNGGDFKYCIQQLEEILKKHPEHTFKTYIIHDCLLEVFDIKNVQKYAVRLCLLHKDNKSSLKLLSHIINFSDLSTIKQLIDEENKYIFEKLDIPSSTKKLLDIKQSEEQSLTDTDITNLTHQQRLNMLNFFLVNDEYKKAIIISKYIPEQIHINFVIEQIRKLKDYKRDVLKMQNVQLKEAIVLSPIAKDAKGTIVYFTAPAAQTFLPIEIMDRFFASMNLNVIYVRDIQSSLHLSGIHDFGDTIDKAVENLQKIIQVNDTPRLYTMGDSGGGMAAIIYANKIHADLCISFSPPSSLLNTFESRARLLINRLNKTYSKESLEIYSYLKKNESSAPIEIFYGSDMLKDQKQIDGFKNIKNVSINPIESCDIHNVIGCICASGETLVDLLSKKMESVTC